MADAPNLADKAVLTRNVDDLQFEAHVDGVLAAWIVYRYIGADLDLVHTGWESEFTGTGVAEALVVHALDTARADGEKVIPTCPFVRSYLAQHPEQMDVIVDSYVPR